MKKIEVTQAKDEKYGVNFNGLVLLDENDNVIDSIEVHKKSNPDIVGVLAMAELILRNSGNKYDEFFDKFCDLFEEILEKM